MRENLLVKVAPLGECVKEVAIHAGETVQKALEIAGIQLNGRAITVNDVEASMSTAITQDGSIIALVAKMKGGRS